MIKKYLTSCKQKIQGRFKDRNKSLEKWKWLKDCHCLLHYITVMIKSISKKDLLLSQDRKFVSRIYAFPIGK